jgi:hypothetical protein
MEPHYNPDEDPDPRTWLRLPEGKRLLLMRDAHRNDGLEPEELMLHANIQVLVENQLAQRIGCAVRAFTRLKEAGLCRHDAVHAIATVLSLHLDRASQAETAGGQTPGSEEYHAELERLTVARWRELTGEA